MHAEKTLETVPDWSVEHRHPEFYAALQEIADILPVYYGTDKETQEKRLQLTPKLTQKLLTLLRGLGYQYPQEVLMEAVRLHGLSSLLVTLQHITQLHAEYMPEIAARAYSLVNQTDDDSTKSKLIKALSSFVLHGRHQELALAGMD